MATVHISISGKVQGVFFRAAAREKAAELQLGGWIRNTMENGVEATVSGRPEAIESFIAWCWQGPPRAQVTAVLVTPKPDTGHAHFKIIR